VFEGVGAFAAGKMTAEELDDLESHAFPGPGACGGQFTANTMAVAFEMLGISPMGSAGVPAMDPRKDEVAYHCGELVMELSAKTCGHTRSLPAKVWRTPSPRSLRLVARPMPSCTCSPLLAKWVWRCPSTILTP
jgi:dihydroxyacid dehydratase/phosphogluconate dehydratase